ncbi:MULTISPECIES: hypothetical protein [Parafrankia]|nr:MULTISPECIES: hypothetical protein [Parafrankia]CAI7980526.1 hypothetical protein FRAHR75_820011 [Frankia sp. Hr75.2]SQD97382.1 hypothetical protein FMEAI12_4030003 [Parafrankia sp. Ea1.12]
MSPIDKVFNYYMIGGSEEGPAPAIVGLPGLWSVFGAVPQAPG